MASKDYFENIRKKLKNIEKESDELQKQVYYRFFPPFLKNHQKKN